MKLFGTDGVRGKAGEFLTAELAMRVAMAAGIYFRKNSVTNMILVGKDTRRSGYMIETAIVAGLTSVGYNVRQIGPMPTPAIAFLTEDMRCDAGIMISASHNPYYDNGIKFFNSEGFKLDEKEEAQIEKIYFSDELIAEARTKMMQIGAAKRVDDVIGRYIVHIKNSFPKQKIVIGDEPNGKNINDACGALSPQNLASEVKRLRADVGFAFDGDADRLVVVDENGEIIHGDALLGILAVYLKGKNRLAGNKMVATVMSNSALEDFLAKHDIALHRCNVGDKFVLETMHELGANFGGEQSGHVIFGDYAKTGDGIASALQFAACMLDMRKKASELSAMLKPYPQILRNLKIADKKPLEKLKGLKELEASLKADKIRSLFRYSGTENVIRLLLEGKNEKPLQKRMDEVEKFFIKALNE